MILNMIAWSFGAGRIGIYPGGKPDQMGWMKGSDDGRAALAGMAMSVVIALVMVKLHWSEVNTTMGFPELELARTSMIRVQFEPW